MSHSRPAASNPAPAGAPATIPPTTPARSASITPASTRPMLLSTARLNVFWLVIFTLTLPLAVVVSTHLARRSFERVKLRDQTITVKGYAEQPIVSDRAEWSGSVLVRDADRTRAYQRLQADRDAVLVYLDHAGFPADGVELGPVRVNDIYARDNHGRTTNRIEAYELTQAFSLAHADVDAITAVARNAGDLIAQGIDFRSSAPQYLYTQLDALKLDMLERATANARQRAGLLVNTPGTTLGPLRSARQGVFQITPAFSTEVSSSGHNDTSSLNKIIRAVVTAEYAIREG